jgi:hypothetical protein
MRELDNWRAVHVDNGKQAGARRSNRIFWILLAPIFLEYGYRFRVEIECEEFCELHDPKWTRGCCDTLEEPVCKFPVLLPNLFQHPIVCFIQSFGYFVQSTPDALSEAVSKGLKLAVHPPEPTLQS